MDSPGGVTSRKSSTSSLHSNRGRDFEDTSAMMHEFTRLRNELRAKDRELEAALVEVKTVKKEMDVQGRALQNAESQLEGAKERLLSYEGDNLSLRKRLGKVEAERDTYRNELERAHKESDRLSREVAALSPSNNDAVTAEVMRLEERIAEMKIEMRQLQDDNKSCYATIRIKDEELERQAKKVAEAEEALLSKKENENIIGDLRRQVTEARAEIETLQKMRRLRDVEVSDLERDHERVVQELQTTSKYLATVTAELQVAKTGLNESKVENAVLRDELSRLNAVASRVARAELRAGSGEGNVNVAQHLQEVKFMQSEIYRLKQKLEHAEKSVKAAQEQKDRLYRRVDALASAAESMGTLGERSAGSLDSDDLALVSPRDVIAELRTELSELREAVAVKEEEAALLASQLEDRTARLDATRGTVVKLKGRLCEVLGDEQYHEEFGAVEEEEEAAVAAAAAAASPAASADLASPRSSIQFSPRPPISPAARTPGSTPRGALGGGASGTPGSAPGSSDPQQLSRVLSDLAAQEAAVVVLERQLSKASQAASAAELARQESAAELEALRQQLADAQAAAQGEATERIDALRQELKDAAAAAEAAAASATSLRAQLAEARAAGEAAAAEAEGVKAELEGLKAQLAEAQAALEAAKAAGEEGTEELRAQLEEAQAAADAANAEVEELREQVEEAASSAQADAEAELEELRRQLYEAQSTAEAASGEAEALAAQLEEEQTAKELEIGELQAKIAGLEEQLEEAEAAAALVERAAIGGSVAAAGVSAAAAARSQAAPAAAAAGPGAAGGVPYSLPRSNSDGGMSPEQLAGLVEALVAQREKERQGGHDDGALFAEMVNMLRVEMARLGKEMKEREAAAERLRGEVGSLEAAKLTAEAMASRLEEMNELSMRVAALQAENNRLNEREAAYAAELADLRARLAKKEKSPSAAKSLKKTLSQAAKGFRDSLAGQSPNASSPPPTSPPPAVPHGQPGMHMQPPPGQHM